MCQIKCLLVLLVINIIGALVVYRFALFQGVLNFEGGFLGFFIVVLSSYYGVTKQLKEKNSENPQEKENNPTKFQKFALGLKMSFNLWRLGGYIVLLGVLGLLLYFHLFNGLMFLIGVFVGSLSSALLRFLKNR
ncbi:hypothetical protein [Helicobacter cetorum]|uniref:ATP synthase I n=1 Tax=Helicobacter cetorum (strain ATCC BAA-429 / MIT 00-7128) TaxID=182217 RepID=I0ELX2_HELC0|nr:hypothetical protein [Helicobacter cetorum]AFI03941.1 hypothetical protein HCW_03310 [Helicobacter cetorum MIT 00-7128]